MIYDIMYDIMYDILYLVGGTGKRKSNNVVMS